jgi:hypothetical protein
MATQYEWLESSCDKKEGYDWEMKHKCNFRCKECSEEFEYDIVEIPNADFLVYSQPLPEGSYSNSVSTHSISAHAQKCTKLYYKYGLKKVIFGRNYGNQENYVCRQCGFLDCICKCQVCGKYEACKIVSPQEEQESVEYICRDCALCFKCKSKWKESGPKRTWDYEKQALCEKCALEDCE